LPAMRILQGKLGREHDTWAPQLGCVGGDTAGGRDGFSGVAVRGADEAVRR